MSTKYTPLEELISIVNNIDTLVLGKSAQSLPKELIKIALKDNELFLGVDPSLTKAEQQQVQEKLLTCLRSLEQYAGLEEKFTRLQEDYNSILDTSGLDDFEKQLLRNLSRFLGETREFGILDPTGPILTHNLTIHTIKIAQLNLKDSDEYSAHIADGELYACQYQDFTIIVERDKPLLTTEKDHIKQTIKYISLQRMQNTLKQAMIMSIEQDSGSELTITTDMENSLQKSLDTLVKEASIDPLTLAFNRRYLLKHVEELYQQDRHFSIIITDIDNFMQFNDTYGHDVGDQVLSEFVNILVQNTRDDDIITRWGGEEFLILLESAELKIATNRAEVLRTKIENHLFKMEKNITASFGVASRRPESEDFKELVRSATEALSQAKKKGRNRVEFSNNI